MKTGKRDEKIALLKTDTDFITMEAYRTIRTNLLFTLQSNKNNRILITSASSGDGKTVNCCNLAIMLAQMDSKVLIIDCNLRKPLIHQCFGKVREPGLSDLVTGINDNIIEVIQHTDYSNLDVICGGTVSQNPAELLASDKMGELLIELSNEYDYILMDTPPTNFVSDALSLSPLSDGVILIVRQSQTTHPELIHSLTSLKYANAKILGVVLNGVKNSNQYKYMKKNYKRYYKTADASLN